MSGEIIDFRRHRELRRAKLYRQQPVPRPPAGETAHLATIDEQVVRILGLLGELEALTRNPGDLPLPLLARARASIDMTSQVFGQVLAAACVEPEEDGGDDPQPEVDRNVLERMYRDLDLQA